MEIAGNITAYMVYCSQDDKDKPYKRFFYRLYLNLPYMEDEKGRKYDDDSIGIS